MDGLETGATFEEQARIEEAHSAHAWGNEGVHVTSTPALIGLIEMACVRYLESHIAAEQTSVGTSVNVDHLAAAPIGSDVDVRATLKEVDGRRVAFDAEVYWGNILLMRGTHQRAILDLERFLASLPSSSS